MIKKFELGGITYKVKEVDSEFGTERLGEVQSALGIVRIANTLRGEIISEESKTQTLYHELIHAILDELGHYELSANEQLVQSVACLLHQFEKTKK